MIWTALLAIAVVFLAPIGGLFSQLAASDLHELIGLRSFVRALDTTLITASVGATCSVVVGTFFARRFALHEWAGKRVQRLLLLLPYLVPNFVLATAYVIGWNPGSGLINRFIPFPGGLYGRTGLAVLFSVVHLPVAFLLLEERFRKIDNSLREAASLSGAGTWKILRSIEIPLLLPTLIAAFALCFALDISAFAIPAWIGAPERVYTFTYKIYQAIQVGGQDGMPRAASYSLMLFTLVIPILALSAWVQRDSGRYVLVSGKSSRLTERRAGPAAHFLFQAFYWAWQVVLWILPLGTLVLTTFVRPGCLQQNGAACFSHFSLQPYRYVLFGLDETRMGFEGSLTYGTLSAVIIVLLSLIFLVFFTRSRWGKAVVDGILTLPIATPGAIIALGLIVTCSGRFGINLYNTAWIVVAAYVIKHMNLAYQPIKNGLANISSSLFEAAKLSGARAPQIWRKILIPLIRPEITGGFFLVLIPILGELTMSVFLVGPKFQAIGTVIFDLQDYADQTSAAALSVLLVVLILIANEAMRWLSRGKLGY